MDNMKSKVKLINFCAYFENLEYTQ